MERFKSLQNIFKGDRIIWIIFFLLCSISIIEVYSSSSILGYKSGNYWYAAFYHTILLFAGFVAMVLVLNVPCKYFKIMTPILVPTSVILLLLVYAIGSKENDAARWIKLFGVIPLQPSEIAKGTLVLATAHLLSQMQTPNGADPKAIRYVGVTALVLIGLVFPENFSTAALMGATVLIMMVIGRVPAKQMWRIIGGLVITVIVSLVLVLSIGKSKTTLAAEQAKDGKQLTEEVDATATGAADNTATETEEVKEPKRSGILHRFDLWRQRIDDFLNSEKPAPKDYDLDKKSQVGHAHIAIASSDFIGVGPGNSVQRDYLPLAFSDFIYAIIFEELGWLGAAFVALLYLSLLFRTGYIAQRCQNTFPAYLAMGLALMIVIQAVFNMMVAVGLAPVTGQPLPLISKGGTSSIINCIYIGVILSISRTAKKRPDAKTINA